MDVWLEMFILMMLSVGCTSDSTFPTYHEGDVAILKFQYNSREITANETIQICMGNRQPFYIAGNISQAGLSDNEVGRFSVQEGNARDEEGNDIYMITVTIQNVTSSDGGTYICSVRKNGQILGELDRRIGLTVKFPPRKADCHFVDNAVPMNKEWTTLECTASRGSCFGFFDCYQDGEKMPYLTRPIHNYTHIKQTMLVKTNQPVVCCSTSYERPTGRPACTDFSWFPLEGTTHQNIEETSQVPTDKPNQQTTTPTKSTQLTTLVEVLTQYHGVDDNGFVPHPLVIACMALALINIIMFSFIVGIVYKSIACGNRSSQQKDVHSPQQTIMLGDKKTVENVECEPMYVARNNCVKKNTYYLA